MIKTPTTLVLGAGASGPTFPTGGQLREKILVDLKNRSGPFHDCLSLCGFPARNVSDFVDAFERSSQPSIDVFLEHREDLQQLGKLVIAYELISCESEAHLTRPGVPHWYPHLWKRLASDAKCHTFENNKLSIVTFNYDRSLEHFLCLAIKHSFNVTDQECCRLFKTIPIVHVHGQLCGLPYLGDGEPYRDYAPDLLPEHVRNAAKAIKIVHEGEETGGDFSRAIDMISTSEKVFFLGFGYHEVNLKRLDIKEILARKTHIHCAGSSFGLESLERQTIQTDYFGGRIRIEHGLDALTFLRRAVSLS